MSGGGTSGMWNAQPGGRLLTPSSAGAPPDMASTGQVTRATTGQVYAQILSDLTAAESLMTLSGGGSSTHQATIGAVRAIRARVYLYSRTGPGRRPKPNRWRRWAIRWRRTTPISSRRDGQDTPEDIFVLEFTPVDFQLLVTTTAPKGRRWTARRSSDDDAAAAVIRRASSPVSRRPIRRWICAASTTFRSKAARSTARNGRPASAARISPSSALPEVLLIKAEAEAQQGKLAEAGLVIGRSARACRSGTARPGGVRATGGDHAILQERRLGVGVRR